MKQNHFLSLISGLLAAVTLTSCSAGISYESISDGININGTDGIYYSFKKGTGAEKEEEMADGMFPASDENKIIENEFVSVATEPTSTFSADVDTASYAMFRSAVQNGYSLSELKATFGASLRTEEMFNYFKYEAELPKEGELFGVRSYLSPCLWNSENVLLTLTLKTEPTVKASANNLVFLIDVSGSMDSDDKLGLLKTTFHYLTEQLDENDTVSIVTYSGAEKVVLEGCTGNKKEMILNSLDSLDASGSTNGEAGLQKAYELAEKYYIKGGNNRIIMASDGDLNVGMSSSEELENYVSEKRESGTYLSTLGFGYGNYRDSNMETLADNGNGAYYYIDSEREAEKVFGTDLISSLYTVAEDVKLQLTFDPTSVASYRLIGYENRVMSNEDFENDTKDAGEVGAGHTVTVCYELKLTESALENEDWMKLAVRYKNPGENKSNLNEYSVGAESYHETGDEQFRFVSLVIETAMLLHDSEYRGSATEETVLSTVSDLKTYCEADEYKSEFAELVSELLKENNK